MKSTQQVVFDKLEERAEREGVTLMNSSCAKVTWSVT